MNKNINKIVYFFNRPLTQHWIPWFLSGMTVIAFLLRLLACHLEPVINNDGIFYIDIALQWSASWKMPLSDYLPLYPWMIKELLKLSIPPYYAGVGINIFFGSLLPLVIYGIIRTLTAKREVALYGALLLVFHPLAIDLSIHLLRDVCYLFFSGTAIYFTIQAIKNRKWFWWIFCSLSCVMGLLSRYETVELLLGISVYFMMALIFQADNRRKNCISGFIWIGSLMIFFWIMISVMGVQSEIINMYIGRFERIWTMRC